MTDLAQDLSLLGHEITVVTTTPHNNVDSEARREHALYPFWGRWVYRSTIGTIHAFHVHMRPKGSRTLGRMWDFLLFHILSIVVVLRLGNCWDVIFAPSPPLSIGFVAWLLGFLKNIPYIYNVQEIHPDSLIDLGILRNPILIGFARHMERFIYNRARALVVISEHFAQNINAKRVPLDKIHVIPNFVDTDWITPQPRQNAFSAEHNLNMHFVLLYSGNLGWAQDIHTLLEVAEALREQASLKVVIIGGGVYFTEAQRVIRMKQLSNVLLMPYQPRSLVPQIYGTADICWVGLRSRMAYTHVPSKVYTIMSAARPILLAAETDSEVARLIRASNCGFIVPPENSEAVIETIKMALDNRERVCQLGNNGRRFVLDHFARSVVVHQYHKLFIEINDQ
ncbi:MAG: glycosyltransferase [Anaerolineae bacterium]